MQMIQTSFFGSLLSGSHDLDQIPAVRHLLRHQLPSLDLRDPGCSDLGCHLGLEPEARQGPPRDRRSGDLEIWRELVPLKNGANLAGEVGNARKINENQI